MIVTVESQMAPNGRRRDRTSVDENFSTILKRRKVSGRPKICINPLNRLVCAKKKCLSVFLE